MVLAMGEAKNELEYDIETTLDDCIDKLKDILQGLENRELPLRDRARAVDLRPTPVVFLRVRAKQRGSNESLTIELGWRATQHLGGGREESLQSGRRDNEALGS